MSAYDDYILSCPMCSVGFDPDALCDCDVDPMCVRCHRVYHVEQRRWTDAALDQGLRDGLANWGAA